MWAGDSVKERNHRICLYIILHKHLRLRCESHASAFNSSGNDQACTQHTVPTSEFSLRPSGLLEGPSSSSGCSALAACLERLLLFFFPFSSFPGTRRTTFRITWEKVIPNNMLLTHLQLDGTHTHTQMEMWEMADFARLLFWWQCFPLHLWTAPLWLIRQECFWPDHPIEEDV